MTVTSVSALGEEDARILALESGHIRGHTLKILVVDDAPDESPLEELRSSMSQRLAAMPRWRSRLVAAPGTPTGLGWAEDPDFDIARHVRPAAVSESLDGDGFRRLVAGVMATPLERDRPLWTLDVVPRMADGRWAVVWKVHHCLADGMAIVHAGADLLWSEERRGASRDTPARRGSAGAPAQVAAGVRLVRVLGYRGLFLREFRRVRGLSPLAGEVGAQREVAVTECTLDELRAVGRAAGQGVTVNDVLVAAVAGGIRGWLLARDTPISRLKAQIPVSMHPVGGPGDSSGNRDSFLLIELPLAEADPVARLRSVSASTQRRKNRHDARAIYALRRSLGHAPEPVRRTLQHVVQGPHEYSLSISNVPGPAGPTRVLGHRVHAMYSVAEVAPHHALRVAAVSLDGTLYVSLCADPQVVADLESLAKGIRGSVEEMTGRLTTGSV